MNSPIVDSSSPSPQRGTFPTGHGLRWALVCLLAWPASWTALAAEGPSAPGLVVHAATRATNPIPRLITGKFAEHLGDNIHHGMSAQVLDNPTLAAYPFWTGRTSPDGVATFLSDPGQIASALRGKALSHGWPESEMAGLAEAYTDGLACGWTRAGLRDQVQVSPDTGVTGGRAQRFAVRGAGQGIAQWVWLPLHRVRKYEWELLARSPGLTALTLSLGLGGTNAPLAQSTATGLSPGWGRLSGSLELPADAPADAPYLFSVTADAVGQCVLARVLLRPADHVQGADPEVVRLLKESRLPILRWPGGNFVSGYQWEDGVGPAETRPTRPNLAWGGVEPNLFGTDEFIAFCRAVGAEPMICINGGNGTPGDAARWVEYCNGSTNTPMGALRDLNGHPEPYRVKHWEVGNELWGKWQVHWTTAEGYVDRYQQFALLMRAVDPTLRVYACGAPMFWGKEWNDTLIAGLGGAIQCTTDHPLIGGDVPRSTEPMDVYRDFMAVPGVLESKWAALRDDLARGGVKEPRLAVTELQLFAHLGPALDPKTAAKLSGENLVNPGTLAEALYDILIYHAAVRLAPFVEMVTHSATVNHGGGLRKERERVYANPCHHAQAAFAAFADAVPVAVELVAPEEKAPLVLPELRKVTNAASFKAVDALAAVAPDGSLLLSLVHRGTAGPLRLPVTLDGFNAAAKAEVRTLAGPTPWSANTRLAPDAVQPVDTTVDVAGHQLTLDLPPFSVLRVRIPAKAE